jgi:hypothetical protein
VDPAVLHPPLSELKNKIKRSRRKRRKNDENSVLKISTQVEQPTLVRLGLLLPINVLLVGPQPSVLFIPRDVSGFACHLLSS